MSQEDKKTPPTRISGDRISGDTIPIAAQSGHVPRNAPPPELSFWDTTWSLIYAIAAIMLGRWLILEPFKIPSGSMEPTLIGHEDYGDRIVTNKLAYIHHWQAAAVLAGALVVILIGFIVSKGWRRKFSFFNFISILVLGGLGWFWHQGDIAGTPQRFDIVVFEHESAWENPDEPNKKVNYIKRLIGLPGEKIMISGGDLFKYVQLNPSSGKYETIRMWATKPAVQESLWYPVSKAWAHEPYTGLSKEEAKQKDLSEKDIAAAQESLENLRFPWSGAEAGKPGVKSGAQGLELDGTAPVELAYKYPITNIHVRQGRWPFRHVDCPAAHLTGNQSPDGIIISNPLNKPEDVSIYVSGTCDGLECPNCKQVMFPISTNKNQKPYFEPLLYTEPGTNKPFSFFNASDDVVGNLKLDLEIEVAAPGGALEIEVGSNFHRARWDIPPAPEAAAADASAHSVTKPTPALPPGKHKLTLAYVDATVVAALDGVEIERRKIDAEPLKSQADPAANLMKSVVRVKANGLKGRITQLDLYRDLIHIPKMSNQQRRPDLRNFSTQEYTQIFEIPEKEYLMLGDNGPSSADSRIWGFVPEENIIGRASFIWWPPSRWRIIK